MVPKKDGPSLAVELGKLKLKNPVIAASGTFGYGEEYAGIIPLKRLGALITKGLSLEPRRGNPPPRLAETPSGMLNAIGLENVGLEAFLRDKMRFLRRAGCSVLVNIFGCAEEEYAEMARRLSEVEGIAGLEANISCPNVKVGRGDLRHRPEIGLPGGLQDPGGDFFLSHGETFAQRGGYREDRRGRGGGGGGCRLSHQHPDRAWPSTSIPGPPFWPM